MCSFRDRWGGLKTTPPRVVYRISYAVFHKVKDDFSMFYNNNHVAISIGVPFLQRDGNSLKLKD